MGGVVCTLRRAGWRLQVAGSAQAPTLPCLLPQAPNSPHSAACTRPSPTLLAAWLLLQRAGLTCPSCTHLTPRPELAEEAAPTHVTKPPLHTCAEPALHTCAEPSLHTCVDPQVQRVVRPQRQQRRGAAPPDPGRRRRRRHRGSIQPQACFVTCPCHWQRQRQQQHLA